MQKQPHLDSKTARVRRKPIEFDSSAIRPSPTYYTTHLHFISTRIHATAWKGPIASHSNHLCTTLKPLSSINGRNEVREDGTAKSTTSPGASPVATTKQPAFQPSSRHIHQYSKHLSATHNMACRSRTGTSPPQYMRSVFSAIAAQPCHACFKSAWMFETRFCIWSGVLGVCCLINFLSFCFLRLLGCA